MSINRVTILGNVCGQPEVKTFDDGGKVASFSLATNERAFKTKSGVDVPEKVDFHNIVVKGGLAKIAESYINKGDKIYIEGKLSNRKYEKDGVTHYITEIIVSNDGAVELLGKKGGVSENSLPEPDSVKPDDTEDLPF